MSRWRKAIVGVAVEEMAHLALVANLTAALGARPHFDRPNFPVAPGYHPAGVVVELAPLDAATLDHFVFLERPDDVPLADGDGFAADRAVQRESRPGAGLMPGAVEYATAAGFYRRIRTALLEVAGRIGETRLFVGDVRRQIGPDVMALDGLATVTDLASALAAIDTIVVQGEGAPRERESSHFRQFVSIRDEHSRLRARRSTFEPAHPVARSPVMRKPAEAGRVHVDAARAAAVLDVANALYNAMLRLLTQAWGRADGGADAMPSAPLVDAAVGLMQVLGIVASYLSRLPASPSTPGINAGMSFTMLRATSPWIESRQESELVLERMAEIHDGMRRVAASEPPLDAACRTMGELIDRLGAATGRRGRK